jgi:hypothetical protein
MSREFDILFGRKIKKVYRSFDKLEIGMGMCQHARDGSSKLQNHNE